MAKINTKKIAKKTTDTVKKIGDVASENPKSILYGVLAIGGIYVGYKTYKAISNAFTSAPVDDEVDNVGSGNTSNATITQNQASNFAQQLLDAMNVDRYSWIFGGTDEDTIEAVFDNLNNGDDFLLVFHAFGDKDYNGYNSPVNLEAIDVYQPRNLVYWLNSEINSFWDSALHTKIKQRVESAGFSF